MSGIPQRPYLTLPSDPRLESIYLPPIIYLLVVFWLSQSASVRSQYMIDCDSSLSLLSIFKSNSGNCSTIKASSTASLLSVFDLTLCLFLQGCHPSHPIYLHNQPADTLLSTILTPPPLPVVYWSKSPCFACTPSCTRPLLPLFHLCPVFILSNECVLCLLSFFCALFLSMTPLISPSTSLVSTLLPNSTHYVTGALTVGIHQSRQARYHHWWH